MKQVLAVLVAVALIGGAYYVRTEFIEADTSEAADDAATGAGDSAGSGAIACDERLQEGCPADAEELSLDELLDAFAGDEAPYDIVVAPAAVVEMIEQSQTSRVQFAEDRPVVAMTPMVAVLSGSASSAVSSSCGDPPTWSCLAELTAAGDLRPGFGDPTGTSDGIVALAGLTGGFLDDAGAPFSTNGFSVSGFVGWLGSVQDEAQLTPSAAENVVRFAGAQNDSALVTEASGLSVVGTAGGQTAGLTVSYPEPIVVVRATVVGVEGVDTGGIPDDVGDALQEVGWRSPDGTPTAAAPDDAPGLPADDDGLPSGGVLYALQQRWSS